MDRLTHLRVKSHVSLHSFRISLKDWMYADGASVWFLSRKRCIRSRSVLDNIERVSLSFFFLSFLLLLMRLFLLMVTCLPSKNHGMRHTNLYGAGAISYPKQTQQAGSTPSSAFWRAVIQRSGPSCVWPIYSVWPIHAMFRWEDRKMNMVNKERGYTQVSMTS